MSRHCGRGERSACNLENLPKRTHQRCKIIEVDTTAGTLDLELELGSESLEPVIVLRGDGLEEIQGLSLLCIGEVGGNLVGRSGDDLERGEADDEVVDAVRLPVERRE